MTEFRFPPIRIPVASPKTEIQCGSPLSSRQPPPHDSRAQVCANTGEDSTLLDVTALEAEWDRDHVLLEIARQRVARQFLWSASPRRTLHGSRRLGRSNIVGVGLGPKFIGGAPTRQLAVVVHVVRKVDARLVEPNCLIPRSLAVQGRNILTDIFEAGQVRFLGGGDEIYTDDPLDIGTLGCVVERGGKKYILTNYHVVGKFGAEPKGTPIYSDGVKVGTLQDFIPLHAHTPNTMPDNLADAALVEIDPNANVSSSINGIAPIHPNLVGAVMYATVQKSGAGSGVTTGGFRNRNVDLKVIHNGKTYGFPATLVVLPPVKDGEKGLPFVLPGDSGALVLQRIKSKILKQDAFAPCALLFAGTPSGAGYAISLNAIMQSMNISAFVSSMTFQAPKIAAFL